MANNPALYNAVIAGITAGNQKRWQLIDSPANFTIFTSLIEVIATEIDSKIESILPAPNPSQVALMHSICEGYFQDQYVETIRHNLPNVADAIVAIYNAIDPSLLPVPGAVELNPGQYMGQPLAWSGSSWEPLPPSDPLRLTRIKGASNGSTSEANITDGEGIAFGINHVETVPNKITLGVYAEGDPMSHYSRIQLSPQGVTIDALTGSGSSQYVINDQNHRVFMNGQVIMTISEAGVGFFGASPTKDQPITGASDSALLDSIVDALVAYGLVIDNR